PFRESGGGSKPAQAGCKVCWAPDEGSAVKMVHRLWANQFVPGQLAQELALPAFFEQASEFVTEDMVPGTVPCGPDPERHLRSFRQYVDAGFDEIYVSQIGPHHDGFFDFYAREVLPEIRRGG